VSKARGKDLVGDPSVHQIEHCGNSGVWQLLGRQDLTSTDVIMIFVKLASGNYGIGVVGHNLTKALSALTEVERLDVDHPPTRPLPGPLLERFYNPRPAVPATRNIAYVVFENDLEVRNSSLRSRCRFDALAATSRWCEDALREAGIASVVTIHHGVDGRLFNPDRAGGSHASDRFVIFTGGKFEFRKAQDVVVYAFRTFSERHPDATLVAAWHNPWPEHMATMQASPYFPFQRELSGGATDAIKQWLNYSGIDLNRVKLIPQLPNAALAMVYAATDVGVFASRCEGATNLVMMEYMACGRPVIATDFAGHRDILSEGNSLALRRGQPLPMRRDGRQVATWREPDVDELLENLETAYRDRDRLRALGRQAAVDLKGWSWGSVARSFLELLTP
jgi:glycosyltransferase involved in cell wall biosynthesis